MTENLLKQFLDGHSYDIRQTGNGRWIDQKCTPDEVSFVSDSGTFRRTTLLPSDAESTRGLNSPLSKHGIIQAFSQLPI